MIKVMIAEDNIHISKNCFKFLTNDENIKVVSCTLDGEETLKDYFKLQPDVLLLDLNMPKINGIDVINTIGRLEMSVCYDKLWKMLIDKRMNKTDLKDKAGISFNVLAKMGKGESVSLESLHKICKTLKCDIGDIIEFSDEKIDIM